MSCLFKDNKDLQYTQQESGFIVTRGTKFVGFLQANIQQYPWLLGGPVGQGSILEVLSGVSAT